MQIRCAACGTENRPGRRFCAMCGGPLRLACPSCGAANEPDERFCGECGAQLASQASSAVAASQPRPTTGERKMATLLFADIVGFTSMGEHHDPEIVQSLVSRAFDRLSEEVHRYEGLIEKFAGDALLAVFGVPGVHEDDPERAVRAALEMQSAILRLSVDLREEGRPELALRIGIESGEVLVDQARAGAERDRMVTGDPVNTAARLQQAASPGSVVVGPATYAATRDVIEYDELETIALKGKGAPIAAWRAVAVKARRGGLRAPLGIEAPLIGRDEEFALLKETVRRTVAEGRPHLVTVLASAGVGKSRLAWELEKYLDGLPDVYHWRKGRCLAYGATSYSALADAVKDDAKILDDDASEVAEQKMEERLSDLGVGAGETEMREALALLVGGAGGSRLSRDDLFEALRRYLASIAGRAPMVLVLEDIHWADEGLLDFIEFLARWGSGPIVTFCLARHELLERRATWGGGIPNAATIVLEPLNSEESANLVAGLLEGALPAEFQRRIVQLAEGNPLFTEELVRMFVDRGVLRFADGSWQLARSLEEVEVPGSIQAVLAARLDGLPGAEKRLAQDAAVVGRIFWDAVVAHLEHESRGAVGDLLRRLRVKELVVPREPSSLTGSAEFGFRHVLIRDVAYDSLPKRDRAAKHLEVARWAEGELGNRADEFAELLASHYLSALRYAEEFQAWDESGLRGLREKTIQHARRAGHRATSLWEAEAATRWLRLAVDQTRRLGVRGLDLAELIAEYLDAGSLGYEPMEPLIEASAEALAALERIPRDGAVERLDTRVRLVRATSLYFAGRVEESRSVLQQGLAKLEAGPPSRERASLLTRLGWTYWRAGPTSSAIEPLERAIQEARATEATDVLATAIHEIGIAKADQEGPGAGLPYLRESFTLAQATRDHDLLLRCHTNIAALVIDGGGDVHEVIPLLESGLAQARRELDRSHGAWLAGHLAWALTELGRLKEADVLNREAIRLAEELGDVALISQRWHGLAFTLFARGRREEAATAFAEAERRRETPEPQQVLWEAQMEAFVRWPSDARAAVELLSVAVDSVPEGGGRGGIGDALWWLARGALRTEEHDEYRRAVARLAEFGSRAAGATFSSAATAWQVMLDGDSERIMAAASEATATLDGLGRRLKAADLWADAALVLTRGGAPADEALERAAAIYAECGATPVLGDLPETRWISPAVAAPIATSHRSDRA